MSLHHFHNVFPSFTSGVALIILLASFSLAPAEGLELELRENSVVLTWPGEELLFASPSLENFSLVENAQSPFEQSSIGIERFFFQLRTLPQISVPIDDSVVGTELINVRGLVGTALAGSENLTVTVNGQDAQISTNPEGELEFILPDFPLTEGLNTLTLVFSTGDGGQRTETRSVSYEPVVANNIVIAGDFAYAAQGVNGLAVVNLMTRTRTLVNARVDDLSFDGTFLFTLNTGSGSQALSVYSLVDPANPVLISGPLSANTGFFSGVSAANGRVVVAGGTSPLSIRSYNRATGVLSRQSSNLDIALGHPDVLLSPNGELAYASVDFPGTRNGFSFGLATVSLNDPPQSSTLNQSFGLANFNNFGNSSGGQTPANFPVESALVGNRLLVTSGTNLSILSSDGTSFQEFLPLGFFAVNVDGNDTTAYVVGSQNGTPTLAEVDLSIPSSPTLIAATSFPGEGLFTSVSVNENLIVIAGNDGGLRILNRN